MKILLVSPEDLKGKRWGGVSTYNTLLAEELVNLGNQVSILTPGNKNEFFYQNGIKIYRIHHSNRKKKTVFLKIYYRFLGILNRFLSDFTKRLYWILDVYLFVEKHGPFDIIETPEWGSSALFISLFSKQKLIVRLHRGWYFYKKDNNLPFSIDDYLISLLELLSVIFATAITSPTRYMLARYKKILCLLKLVKGNRNFEVISNGMKIDRKIKCLTKDKITNYILFVGRLEKAKGADVIIKAFKKISKKFKKIKLLMIGESTNMQDNKKMVDYKTFLLRYLRSHKLEKQIFILSRKSREQLSSYYSDCLFCVVPSVGNENLPTVLLEAISFDKALISSNTGGIPEVIRNNINGLLFQPGAVKDLAEKILILLKDRGLRFRFETYNAELKYHYDIKKTARETLNFYQQLTQ